MASTDIFNFSEQIEKHTDDANKEALTDIVETFQKGNFVDVLSKLKDFRDNNEINDKLNRLLLALEATCSAQINEVDVAKKIITDLYNDDEENTIDDLMLYGNLAFMADLKLSRRIMSEVVKKVEAEEEVDIAKAGQAYLVLGETEEHLRNVPRAMRYYEKALAYAQEDEEDRENIILFIYFKLGALSSVRNETDEALEYLQKAVDLAGEDQKEIKINSLLSIAKLHNRLENYEKAHDYLEQIMPLIEESSLKESFVHAESLTDLAYNYFSRKIYDKAAETYEIAVDMHEHLPNLSVRELGMIYMQYAYCLENMDRADKNQAAMIYDRAYENLKLANDQQLLVDAVNDIVRFADEANKTKMKKTYENRLIKLVNEANAQQ